MKTVERTSMEAFKRFCYPYTQKKKLTLRAVTIYGLWAIGSIIHILFVQKLVGIIEDKNIEAFWNTITIYVSILVVYYVVLFLIRKWGWVETVNGYRKIIQDEYVSKYITLSNTEVEKMGTGKTISLIDSGMDNWALYLDKSIYEISKIVTAIIFTVYMISLINIGYAAIFLVLYLFVHFLGEKFNKKSLVFRLKRQDVWNEYIGYVVKILMSKFEILQNGKAEREVNNMHGITDRIYGWNAKMATPMHWLYFFPEMFMAGVKVFFIIFLGYQIILGNTTFATFVGLFGLLTLMDGVIENSMRFYTHFTKDFTKIQKMWDFFDSTPDIVGYEQGKDFEFKKGKIELKNIDFGYIEDKKIFENFSMTIEGGKVTALVGNSGSGKSTLVKLVSGYIRQDSGDMVIDDQNLREVNLKSFYRHIGYLTQEPSVFDGTVYDNLTYAIDRELKDDEMDIVLKQAKCEFVYELEKGLDTEIGEKGIRLSGGQRQRLAIAKIFLKNPEIIILDEPTSALDSFSEEQITKALNNLFAGRTVIIIAHRLQTVKHADKILVLKDGEVAEEGNHDELISQEGIYKKMLDLQSGF